MNYESMSDFEINKAVAETLGKNVSELDDSSPLGMTSKYHEQYPNTTWVQDMERDGMFVNRPVTPWYQYSPCNEVEDAWPIIIENKITIDMSGALHCFALNKTDGHVKYFSSPDQALRSAMTVFLMMQTDT